MAAPTTDVGAVFGRLPRSDFGDVLAARAERLIVAIDKALTEQVNAIFHAPEFAAMEARWRALAQLVDHASCSEGVIIRILDMSWKELSRNLESAIDYDQSHLFRLVYDEEFGMPGGLPFGLIVGDYAVSGLVDRARGDQVETLRRLAATGAAAFCPILVGAAPDLLGLSKFSELRAETDLSEPRGMQDADATRIRWNALRDEEDTRFLGIVAPRLIIRAPYRRYSDSRTDGFTFDEDPDRLLMCNGAFAFASTVISAYVDSGWFAAIRGALQDADGGGRVTTVPPYDFKTERHSLSAQPPVEARITAAQETSLIDRGIIPISTLYLEPSAIFNANPSLHRPASYSTAIANQNARLAAMLQYVLCTSRFAHYLRVIMREEIGAVADPRKIETQLSDWLREYCLGNDNASQDLKAQFPLRDSGVQVSAVAGRPGVYACTVRLQPHFQLDDISTSFHLVTETNSAQKSERNIA